MLKIFLVLQLWTNIIFAVNTDSLISLLRRSEGQQRLHTLHQLYLAVKDTNAQLGAEYAKEALGLKEIRQNPLLQVQLQHALAMQYYLEAKYRESLDLLYKSSSAAESLQYKPNLTELYYLLGIIHRDVEHYGEAMAYFQKDSILALALNDTSRYVLVLNEIGNLYFLSGSYEHAIPYKTHAYQIALYCNDKFGLSCVTHDLGLIYETQGKLKLALEYYKKSREIDLQTGSARGVIIADINMANIYQTQSEYLKMRSHLEEALPLAKKHNYRKELASILRLLAGEAAKRSDFASAFQYSSQADSLNEVLYNEETTKQISELQTKYEAEKKEKQILLLKDKTDSQENLRNILLMVLFFLLLLTFILYSRFRFEKRTKASLHTMNLQLTEANLKLIQSEKELTDANAAKIKFFSIISHDLKNPFVPIFGYLEMLLSDSHPLSDLKRKEMLTRVSESANQIYLLLENLLQWARCHNNQITVRKERLDINLILVDLIKFHSPLAQKKKIFLHFEKQENGFVFADEPMISTVLRNLIGNAIKFTEESGTVRVSVSRDNHHCIVKISDDGVGMEGGMVKQLFDIAKIHSTVGTANEKGTGLGLLLCKEFLIKNDAWLEVESTPGKGSDFSVYLPLFISQTASIDNRAACSNN